MTEKTETAETTNWLQEEAEKLKSQIIPEGEKLPALELIENKIVKFDVDFSEKFKLWKDTDNNNMKAMIPCEHDGVRKLLWLNIKNPLYTQIILKGQEGQKTFKVLQTGNKNNTRYTIVDEE